MVIKQIWTLTWEKRSQLTICNHYIESCISNVAKASSIGQWSLSCYIQCPKVWYVILDKLGLILSVWLNSYTSIIAVELLYYNDLRSFYAPQNTIVLFYAISLSRTWWTSFKSTPLSNSFLCIPEYQFFQFLHSYCWGLI